MIKGLDSLQVKLNSLSQVETEKSLMEGAERLAALIRDNAPVQTGNMRNSVAAANSPDGALVSVDAPYAFFVEYGTSRMPAQPFVRPAIDEGKNLITNEIKDELSEEVRRRSQ